MNSYLILSLAFVAILSMIYLIILLNSGVFDTLQNYEDESEETNWYKYINYNVFTMDYVIKQQKEIVEEEMFDYKFPPKTQLKNFTLSNKGQPKRNIIIASWRTGSTFLGQLVSSVPGTFYFYEPLIHHGPYEVIQPPQSSTSLEMIKKLLKCDYSGLDDIIENAKLHQIKFSHNTQLWKQCLLYPHYCFNHKFFSDICKAFPFQTMKIVRWRLKITEDLLKDEE